MTWTRFMDMHSGGYLKESPFQYIYIELPENQAIRYFYRRFGHHPYSVACSCCGENYIIDYNEDIRQLTGYDRNCQWCEKNEEFIEIPNKYSEEVIGLNRYLNQSNVLVITWPEILPTEIPEYIPDPDNDDWDSDDEAW